MISRQTVSVERPSWSCSRSHTAAKMARSSICIRNACGRACCALGDRHVTDNAVEQHACAVCRTLWLKQKIFACIAVRSVTLLLPSGSVIYDQLIQMTRRLKLHVESMAARR